jgi:hypothetical protein
MKKNANVGALVAVRAPTSLDRDATVKKLVSGYKKGEYTWKQVYADMEKLGFKNTEIIYKFLMKR